MNRDLVIGGAFLTFLPPTTGVEVLRAAYTAYMVFLLTTGFLGLFSKPVRNLLRTKVTAGEYGVMPSLLVLFVLFATEHYILGAAQGLLSAALFAVTHLTSEEK